MATEPPVTTLRQLKTRRRDRLSNSMLSAGSDGCDVVAASAGESGLSRAHAAGVQGRTKMRVMKRFFGGRGVAAIGGFLLATVLGWS